MNEVVHYNDINNDLNINYIQQILGEEQYNLHCIKDEKLACYKTDLKRIFYNASSLYSLVVKCLEDYFSNSNYVHKADYKTALALLTKLNIIGKYINAVDAVYIRKYVCFIFFLALYKDQFKHSASKLEKAFYYILQYPFDPLVIDKWFIELFVKYENPQLFTSNYYRLNGDETEALMLILTGGKVRSFSSLPCRLSRKELFIIVQCFNDTLDLKQDILLKAILIARTTIHKPYNLDFIKVFFSRIKSFNEDLALYQNQIHFWKSAYDFFCKHRIDRESLIDYIDYFEHQLQANIDYSLKGKTVLSVIEARRNWHNQIAAQAQAKENAAHNVPKVWGVKEEGIKVSNGEVTYLFEEITDSQTLQREGSEMRHCVYTYLNDCLKRRCRIFSMQEQIDASYKRVLTLEAASGKLQQIKGKCNRVS